MTWGRDRLLRDRMRERFVVTLVGNEAFEGLLLEADDRSLVLVDASQLSPTGDRVKVDGELVLPRDTVIYLQRP